MGSGEVRLCVSLGRSICLLELQTSFVLFCISLHQMFQELFSKVSAKDVKYLFSIKEIFVHSFKGQVTPIGF